LPEIWTSDATNAPVFHQAGAESPWKHGPALFVGTG
jgi:hypothetical protein